MFGFSKKGPSSKLRAMGHDVDVVSVIRDGNVLFTGDVAKDFPKNHMEGQIFEISFATQSGNPYFVYYLCPDYYFAAVGPAGAASFGGSHKTEKFRLDVSQQIAAFLVQYLQHAFRVDARMDLASFSHNRAHTNVLAYVPSLNNWYAIQHNDSEGDDASERKVALVERGAAQIADVIAIDYPSPSAV
jgi:hypothetical protein